MRKRAIVLGIAVAIIALIILAPVSIVSWEYSNSDAFCSNACHQVHPEESKSHQLLSRHAEVACVECHIGRMGFFDSLWDKAGHVTHAWALLVGYDRPTTSKSMKNAEKSCVNCHTANSHRENTLHTIEKFNEDKKNSSFDTLLIMRLHGRRFGREESLGLDWHTSGAVRYWSSDPQQTEIHRVVADLPDGTQRSYTDVRAAADGSGSEGAVERTLDCLGCHNRVGHPFPDPDRLVDGMFVSGTLPRELPYLKQQLMDLHEQSTRTEGEKLTPEQVRAEVRRIVSEYKADADVSGQLPAERFARMEERVEAWLLGANNLRSQELDWHNFPSHTGHEQGPGCMRCHNGRLQTDDKQIIPVNCTTCHSIPLVVRGRSVPPYYLEQFDLRKPKDHRDPGYLAIHMDEDTESCDRCHGEIEYGEDDASHCSNSACHGRKWDQIDFEAVRAALEP